MFSNPFIVAGIAFVLSVLVTYLVRWFARRYVYVAKPKVDRWHKKPTAMMGGVAIYLTTVSASLIFLPLTNELLIILLGSSFLFLVGLVDDLLHIKPYQKLIGQVIGAAIVAIPAARPSMLSSRFSALVIPISQKTVMQIFTTW